MTLDGDGQNNPADIPLLVRGLSKGAAAPTRACSSPANAPRGVTIPSGAVLARGERRSLLHFDDGVSDTGCSLKLFRRDDFLALPFFNHIHRFIPALMKATGVEVILVGVSHRPRERGTSKYGLWDRLWVGIHDLMGVSWLIRRTLRRVDIEEGT